MHLTHISISARQGWRETASGAKLTLSMPVVATETKTGDHRDGHQGDK